MSAVGSAWLRRCRGCNDGCEMMAGVLCLLLEVGVSVFDGDRDQDSMLLVGLERCLRPEVGENVFVEYKNLAVVVPVDWD